MILFENVSFVVLANFAVALAIVIAAILAVFYIIKWWIMSITAWWDPAKLKQWMHSIRYAIVWFFIVLLAVMIIKIIWAIVWIDFLSYLTFDNVSSMFNLILERLNWWAEPSIKDLPF